MLLITVERETFRAIKVAFPDAGTPAPAQEKVSLQYEQEHLSGRLAAVLEHNEVS